MGTAGSTEPVLANRLTVGHGSSDTASATQIQHTALTTKTEQALQGVAQLSHKHRTSLIAGAVLVMAGFAMTAVAVAPLVNEQTVAQRVVVETLQVSGVEAQLSELSTHEFTLNRSDITRSTDTAETLLSRLGVLDPTAAAFIRGDYTARQLMSGRGGKMVQAQFDGNSRLEQLIARFPSDQPELAKTHFKRLTLTRISGRWQALISTAAYGTQMRLASGTIRNTLFAATDESGLPDSVAAQLAEIFSPDIDFHRQLRQGDTFSVVYETLTADGESVAWNEGAGRVAAAEFINSGKTHQAIWFESTAGRGSYYGEDGRSRKRSFLASPLEFSRVTSGFAMRFHPILQTWRQHNGVDYGAPAGTPVRVVADGVVDFAGWKNGYGNVVEVKHGGEKSTFYAHLSRIDVRRGQRTEQGQRIGAVGSTGWATGPHLHFEFRIAGKHQDPLRAAKDTQTTPLDATSRNRFAEVVRQVQGHLDVAETLSSRQARFE